MQSHACIYVGERVRISQITFPGIPEWFSPASPKQLVPSSWPLVLATQVLYNDCHPNKEVGQSFFPTSLGSPAQCLPTSPTIDMSLH